MKSQKLLNAIGQIDDKFIEDAKTVDKVRRKQVRRQWAIAIAACLLLVLSVGIITPVTLNNMEAGTITMDINPSVEYVISRNGKIKSVQFLNNDAGNALGEIDLKGQTLKSAITLTVAAYKNCGYMESNDTVLISFDQKISGNSKLKNTFSETIRQALEKTDAVHSLVYISATDNTYALKIKEEYNVSQGKAELIRAISEKTDMSLEDLVRLPLDELVGMQKDNDTIIIDTRYIGMMKAKQIALDDAGCLNRLKIIFIEAKLVDGGIKTPYYLLVFNDDQYRWTYRIDASDGGILERNKEELLISLEKAKNIALADAGLADSFDRVTFTKEELNRNQNNPCWILEFYTTKYQYRYRIDAKTGEIVYGRQYIEISRAKEIAIEDSGCSGEIDFTEAELVDDGIKTPYYYFVFNNFQTRWTYRIDANNGAVLEKNEESILFIT